MKRYILKSWDCTNCAYRQDFPPTPALMAEHHNVTDPGLTDQCPSCRQGNLKQSTDDNRKIQLEVLEEHEVDQVKEVDQEKTTDPASPVMRDLTTTERAEVILKIRQAHARLQGKVEREI